jgi:DNA end-binding protein Ku
MVYADEINEPESIPELEELNGIEFDKKELTMARQLIETLSTDFEPEKFHDAYREAVLDMIERKAQGEEIVEPISEVQPEKVVDLMAALEASVQAAKETRKRHPTAKKASGGPKTAKKTATKTATKRPRKRSA